MCPGSPFVFCHLTGVRAGKRFSYGGFYKAWQRAVRAAGCRTGSCLKKLSTGEPAGIGEDRLYTVTSPVLVTINEPPAYVSVIAAFTCSRERTYPPSFSVRSGSNAARSPTIVGRFEVPQLIDGARRPAKRPGASGPSWPSSSKSAAAETVQGCRAVARSIAYSGPCVPTAAFCSVTRPHTVRSGS